MIRVAARAASLKGGGPILSHLKGAVAELPLPPGLTKKVAELAPFGCSPSLAVINMRTPVHMSHAFPSPSDRMFLNGEMKEIESVIGSPWGLTMGCMLQ